MDTDVGGDVLVRNDGSMSFIVDVNRKLMEDVGIHRITDINWYLIKLIPALNVDLLRVESYTVNEYF